MLSDLDDGVVRPAPASDEETMDRETAKTALDWAKFALESARAAMDPKATVDWAKSAVESAQEQLEAQLRQEAERRAKVESENDEVRRQNADLKRENSDLKRQLKLCMLNQDPFN